MAIWKLLTVSWCKADSQIASVYQPDCDCNCNCSLSMTYPKTDGKEIPHWDHSLKIVNYMWKNFIDKSNLLHKRISLQ